MMNVKKSKIALLLAAGAVSMALTGCGGDDGTDGNPGNPGGPAAEYINTLNLKVTDVTYTDGQPTIKVFATNEEDLPVIGLQDLGVVAAQLTPQGATGAGNSAQWTRTARASGVESYTDNKDGSYTFSLELDEYNADMTQRFNVYAGGKGSTLADGATTVPRREIVADFDGQGYEAKYTKDIVSHETCTNCHAEGEPLTTRHSSYYTQGTCATCHSSSMSTESQWNHLIHNIHNTAKTFEDKYGKEYTGEAAEALIQNNCKSCHVEPEADSGELAEWGNWSRIPTMETCTSCHTGIDFEAGKGHSQQADNSNCIACHNSSWTEELHTEGFAQKKAVIDQIGMTATLTGVAEDQSAELSITFTDATGAAIDANSILPKIKRVESITNVGPNFPVMGYSADLANGIKKKVSIDLVKDGALNGAEIVDGSLVINTGELSFGAEGTDADTAFSFIGLQMCNEGTELVDCADGVEVTTMKAELAHGTLSGEAPSVRHTDSVNFKSCESCHSTDWPLNSHTKYHTGFVMTEQLGRENAEGEMVVGVDGCVSCHNQTGTFPGAQGAFETKVHFRHSEEGVVKDCTQCHNDLNLDAFKSKGAIALAGNYTTPITATCSSCHGLDNIKVHAEGQGAKVNVSYSEATDAAQLETCFYCHAPTPADHTAVKM
ncbi:OmcA/MtrC family decaheme c-type cytochrome [Shewanella sp. 10N.286.45.A1]|uniref:OmcA/MtrC family decaheme c-type cytochrome n=1 Tax=Shewanella sp. 10N.286.45.A1 TaxID=3229694 RepID=UPI003553E0E1